MTDAKPAKHPAKYSATIMDVLREVLDARLPVTVGRTHTILDPFAGTGRIHDLSTEHRDTVGIELEPEWGTQRERTIIGDCRDVMTNMAAAGRKFDAIVTSPTYGNRFADRDMRESCAGTYMKGLQHEASEGSSCHMQWGNAYMDFHREVWKDASALLHDGSFFVLNIQDHYRNKVRQAVAGWHVDTLNDYGLATVDIIPVPTPHQTRGANTKRCTELVIVFEKFADERWDCPRCRT